MEQNLQAQLSEIDLLTGCWNLVSFAKGIENNFGNEALSPMTLIGIDVYQLRRVNRTYGFERGDQLLRWLGIALRDEMGNTVYRIAGEAFVIVVTGESTVLHDHRAHQLFERLNNQARQLSMDIPVVTMAVIHFASGASLNTALVWKNLNELTELIDGEEPFKIFDAEPLDDNAAMIRAIELMAERILSLGYMLNVTFRVAYTDPVGNLPNLIATQRKLELTLTESISKGGHFSLCLMDGDDLKRYNTVSYAAGDQLIGQIGSTLTAAIRPGDFVGRWRFGDEFVIILPHTGSKDAVNVADGVRSTIEEVSKDWMFPITVSIGVVEYPLHGNTVEALIQTAEQALKVAKAAGKNRTVVAESTSK
ncbi:MAG TPA: diguanylate cyclase [Anaerolineales bacterium]|nr:diguanylate cyclase [Anaerolineales bacterium]